MAENKKSFILYADLLTTINKMPDDKAGILFKTILSYVNDENPICEDILVDLVFEPIKLQLKRDLKKYESFIENQSLNGKLGGRPKKAEPLNENPKNPSLYLETQKSLNDTVTVNDTPTVKVNVIKETIEERKLKFAESLNSFKPEYGEKLITDFYNYWSESNKSNTKFKQELEKTWQTESRLSKWKSNNYGNLKSKAEPKKEGDIVHWDGFKCRLGKFGEYYDVETGIRKK